MDKQCLICNGKMIEAVTGGNDVVSAEAVHSPNFYTSSYTDKYICLECGHIQEYARNPKVFTDSKYDRMSLEERSNI